jgi:hypothetical protein
MAILLVLILAVGNEVAHLFIVVPQLLVVRAQLELVVFL